MSKIKNGELDQYDVEPFKQQQFGTAGVEGVNRPCDAASVSARNSSNPSSIEKHFSNLIA